MALEKINPAEPVANWDALVHGADAKRCSRTGWVLERGIGAWAFPLQEVANEVRLRTGKKITRAQAEEILRKEKNL